MVSQHIEIGDIDDTSGDLKSKYFESVKYEMEAVVRLQKWDQLDTLFKV